MRPQKQEEIVDIEIALIEKLAAWVNDGDNGLVMCEDCRFSMRRPEEVCAPCPKAWRILNKQIEYYDKPGHGAKS